MFEPKFCSVCGRRLKLVYANPWYDIYTGELIDTYVNTIECPDGHKKYRRGMFISSGMSYMPSYQMWNEING